MGGVAGVPAGGARAPGTVPLQAAAEEYVFRGWFFQAFGARLRSPWPGAVVSALLFAGAHGYGQLAGFVDLVLFALVLTWLTAPTGGLEAAIAYHVVNNLVVFLLGASAGQLQIEETAADAPWPVLVADAVALAVYAVLVLRFAARRSDVDALSPAAGGGASDRPTSSPAAPAAT